MASTASVIPPTEITVILVATFYPEYELKSVDLTEFKRMLSKSLSLAASIDANSAQQDAAELAEQGLRILYRVPWD